MYKTLIEAIENSNSIAISGHIRPDGDCVGSTTALYNYIKHNYPQKQVVLFLENIADEFKSVLSVPENLDGNNWMEENPGYKFDLFAALDSSSVDRLGPNQELFREAGFRFVIDHHKTNTEYGDINIVYADASSACEVLFDQLECDKIDLETARCLYLGIVHDTGVFKFNSTSRHTMEIAGILLEKGVNSDVIIDKTFYEKSWNQNKLLGLALDKARLHLNGLAASTIITRADLEKTGCKMTETDGIVEQLRLTRNVELAIFIREDGDNYYKFSLRSKNGLLDVSEIAVVYNGGGHLMASGFSAEGDVEEILSDVLSLAKRMMKNNGVEF